MNEKNKTTWEHQNGNKDKAKSYNFSSANTSQPQTQTSKKDKRHGSRQGGHLAIEVNITEVSKKNRNKNKAKNLSHIKCYTCK